jgi:C-terminal processing protease CtpA/Prc
LSLQPKTAAVWSVIGSIGLFDEPFTQSDGLELWGQWKNDEARTWIAGSSMPTEDIRIAVLLARDVSGSDFFPYGVKGAKNTRLFGRRTMGAFSTFMIFEMPSYYFWSLASGDFIDPMGQPQIGHGVEPDDNILPTQSDLLAGRDTVYEQALAWVRCGKTVCP